MERITISKTSKLKALIFDGLKSQEYDLVSKTVSKNPFYLFFQGTSKDIALFHCKHSEDELILLNCKNPQKLKIIMNEIARYANDDFAEIAAKLSEIVTAQKPKTLEVVNISQV